MKYIAVEFSNEDGAYEKHGYMFDNDVVDEDIIVNEGILDDFDIFCDAYLPPCNMTEEELNEYYDGCTWEWYYISESEYNEIEDNKHRYTVAVLYYVEVDAINAESAINKVMAMHPDADEYEVKYED